MALSIEHQLLIETRLSNRKKSAGIAFALWFFLGIFAAHRFYLGRPWTAILQILSYFLFIGFIWWVIDAFLIPGMIDKDTEKIRAHLIEDQLRQSLNIVETIEPQ